MSDRRAEALKELQLAPLWYRKETQVASNISKAPNSSVTKSSDIKFMILQSSPCSGSAARLLDNMLGSIDLVRDHNVHIINLPSYKKTDDGTVMQCESFLTKKIELIKPRIIIALGEVVAQNILNTVASVDSLRGVLHKYSGIPLIVTYHPVHLLEIQSDKEKAWRDLCFARNIIQN
ncbi:MAG: hypothetical protein CMH70_08600 [Nitrosomonadaceae bacterium]|nr:hypothetical protein [Nitrosomonadaceae bacterium]|tara:strand:+ start:688 stop:1218 length:531 start_codon:yes stop_codon:yes gene_type:complete